MVKNNVDQLDNVLQRRAEPQARSNLAERIIDASLAENPHQKQARFGSWLNIFSRGFLIPRPALALATILVVGLFVGYSYQLPLDESDADLEAYFLYIDDILEEDSWL